MASSNPSKWGESSGKGKAKRRGREAEHHPHSTSTEKGEGANGISTMYLPRESKRMKRALDWAAEDRKKRRTAELTKLRRRFGKRPSLNKKKNSLKEWCVAHVDETYPGLGKVAYAVPPYAISPHSEKKDEKTSFYMSKKQESDVRGHRAERQVVNNFWILNNTFELTRKPTMFIISRACVYEQTLKGLSDSEQTQGIKELVRSQGSKYFQTPEEAIGQRKDPDIILLHKEKGVIFIQVKSVSMDTQQLDKNKTDKKRAKIKKGLEQLQMDCKVFEMVMKHRKPKPCHLVLALPNIKTEEEIRNLGVTDKDLQDVTLLLQSDLITEEWTRAGIQSDVTKIKNWFEKLDSREAGENFLEDMIARYIGDFSTPYPYNADNERSQILRLRDSIRFTAKLTKRLITTEAHKKVVGDLSAKRVHISGAPGSGRTTLLIRKAEKFLKGQSNKNVVVLDMYRGFAGRPIGLEIFKSISQNQTGEQCHHLQIDVLDKEKAMEKISALQSKINAKNTLFIVDEVLPKHCSVELLEKISTDFRSCQIWCADGLVHEELGGFDSGMTSYELPHILRMPSSVQRVLWQTDWDNDRKKKYKDESEFQPTDGPMPLSVRHSDHKNFPKPNPIINCEQCADDLADLLEDKINVQDEDTLTCSVAILFNVPQDKYSVSDEGRADLDKNKFRDYWSQVNDCSFIKRLKQRGLPVKLLTLDEDKDLENEENWDKLLVSWVDWFQGLERDIVIFLPAGLPPDSPTTSRRIPEPGLSFSRKDQRPGFSHLYWKVEDVDRFSVWDKTNLVFAATRCTAQLILLVP